MGDDEKLAELLLRWEERWEQGDDVPAAQLCVDQPELVEPLQQQIEQLKKMAWMTSDEEDNHDAEAAPPDPLEGTTLASRYRIESFIAEGGFGRVYRALDLELQRPVAVKVARQGKGDLLDEARRAAKLRHPGIVPVHDVGCDSDTAFIVSDLIEGKNLAEVISSSRPSPKEAALLVAEVADALHFAHAEGFIHLDLKPANILIDKQGRPLITDFGLAADAEQVARGVAAKSGTLAYMAPEQVAGEIQLIGPRTDIYALGVVLYEILTSRLPYQARTPMALREQILFRQPMPVRSINQVVPTELDQICLHCLAKHPSDRPTSAAELASSLRSPPSRTASEWPRRAMVMIAFVVIIFACGLMVGTRFAPSTGHQPSNEVPPEQDVFLFDGTNRIVTPLERFAPVTLEAWIQPRFYPKQDCQFAIGSDIPTKHGIGLGMCEALLSVEYISGVFHSSGAIPLNRWSHVAAVFGDNETRLYVDGRLVGTGPATQQVGGTIFVIGNVGKGNPINFFVGKIRAVRISQGERYAEDFAPDEKFVKDAEDAPVRAVMIFDGASVEGDRVIDLSGMGNDGSWERK